MTNAKSTKRALISSVIALLVCFTMLLGTTFAWFTDSVTSAGNIIQSGNLDVAMYWAEGQNAVPAADSTDWTDASTGAIFKYENWEPGYAVARHIKIANEGTLALKYIVRIVANGTVSDLADVIDVYYLDPAAKAERATLTESNKLGTLTQVLAGMDTSAYGELAAKTEDTITLVLKMQETAGNEYMNKSIGASFSVQLLATQLTAEEDSFDDQYDVDAEYGVEVSNEADLEKALALGGKVIIAEDITVSKSLTVPAGAAVELDLNGKTLTGATSSVNVFVNEGGLTITGSGEITTRNILNRPGAKLVIDGDITVIGGAPTAGSAIWNEGDAVINNVTIQQTNTTNYAIKNADANATMIVNNATVTSKHGAIANDVGTMTVNGGTYDVTGSSTDHVIYAPNGGVTVNDGTFKLSQANASSLGSTIIDGAVTVNGGTFDSVDGALAYNGETGLVINGGTFLNKATTVYGGDFAQFVADGYVAVKKADGEYVVEKGATVSDVASLADALEEGGNIVLSGDIALTDTLMAKENAVIDLNGNTITAPSNGNMFHSQSNAAPSMTITSSTAGAEINISGGDTAVLLGYGSTVIENVTINITGCDNYSPNPFNVYGDLTLGEGTVVNVDYLGASLISNNGAVDVVIDGAEINIGTFKTNGTSIIALNQASTLKIKDTDIKIDEFVLSSFGGDSLVSKIDGVTIENCTFDVTDSNGASCTFVAKNDKYRLVQN